MNDSYLEKLLRSSRTFFGRWNGAHGELWELTHSHRTLVILLRPQVGEGNLYVACLDPLKITGPVRWTDAKLELSLHQMSPRITEFRVIDRGAGLDVLCGGVELKENVKVY